MPQLSLRAVLDGGSEVEFPLQFDLITSWEVMEHLPEDRLATVCDNINRHLLPSGIVVMSISSSEDVVKGVRLHQTVKNKAWWQKTPGSHSLHHLPDLDAYFNTQYIRGRKQNASDSFHLILLPDLTKRPLAPKPSASTWILDRWLLSKGQKALRTLLIGQ